MGAVLEGRTRGRVQPIVLAYCAPGGARAARIALDVHGLVSAELEEHPWLSVPQLVVVVSREPGEPSVYCLTETCHD